MLTAESRAVDEGSNRGSDLHKSFARVAKTVEPDSELVHHRQVHAAHLTVRLTPVIEYPAALELAAGAAQDHHGQLIGIVVAALFRDECRSNECRRFNSPAEGYYILRTEALTFRLRRTGLA